MTPQVNKKGHGCQRLGEALISLEYSELHRHSKGLTCDSTHLCVSSLNTQEQEKGGDI